jgi:hypothetical protein
LRSTTAASPDTAMPYWAFPNALEDRIAAEVPEM